MNMQATGRKRDGILLEFEKVSKICTELFILIPSSAGIERMFSRLGYILDETRNRLSVDKAEKLAFCFRLLD